MLYLYIKGDPRQAKQALRDRGVEPTTLLREGPTWDAQIALVGDNYKNTVMSWFKEDVEITDDEYGFPAGTLIDVQEKKDVIKEA